MGGYLDAVIPLIMHFVELKEESGDDELKESCLQAFEALALRCFREITPYIKEVWHHVLREGGLLCGKGATTIHNFLCRLLMYVYGCCHMTRTTITTVTGRVGWKMKP